MKKLLYILPFFILFFQFNRINLCYLFDETNQIDQINQVDQKAYAQTSQKQPGSADIPEDYVIGKGDVISVFVWRNEQLSSEVVVRPDGKISLPLIQDLHAEGLTVTQLKEEITRKFNEYINGPKVTVIVKEINSYKVSVLGRVATPGVYRISGDTRLVEAISMAGGFTEWANKRKITVITHEGGKKKRVIVNYENIVSEKDPSQNIILKRGDTIIVKEINSYKVSVLGRVATPGVYRIIGDTRLVEAISMAGGFTEWAKKRKITVIRDHGGKKKKLRINYNKIVSGKDPSQNIILKRGDTIIVP